MDFNTLKRIYLLQLKDLYSAEKQQAEALPRFVRTAVHKELKTALREHLELTKVHASRIELIFEKYKTEAGGEHCNTMEDLLEEVEDMVEENETPDACDVHIISGYQKVEHYEIACYGSAITFARGLGDEKAAEILQQSLDEEYEMDNKLDKLGEELVNIYAKVSS